MRTKAYVALFICLATKAIHLELVSDLTTAAFLAAFRQFIARRGLCRNVYSDNATNIIGAKNQLSDLYQLFVSAEHQKSLSSLTQEGVTWHTIPPNSPHFGGLWEAGKKSMKYHLHRAVGL